jgi:hypothetical protein
LISFQKPASVNFSGIYFGVNERGRRYGLFGYGDTFQKFLLCAVGHGGIRGVNDEDFVSFVDVIA